MAHKRKDTLCRTKVNEWNKHMKPYGKRVQNKAERRAGKIHSMTDLVHYLDAVEEAAKKPWPPDFWDC